MQRDENSWLVDGVTPISDVMRAFDILEEFPENQNYETIAGFIMYMPQDPQANRLGQNTPVTSSKSSTSTATRLTSCWSPRLSHAGRQSPFRKRDRS